MGIDWSKAPEGATHSNREGTAFHYFGGGFHLHWLIDKWVIHGSKFENYDTPGELVVRPCVWVGGLPPIGTVCEMIGCKADPETIDYAKYKNHIGKNVTIVAHHDVGRPAAVYACAVGDGEFEYYSMIAGCFAPVRTQAQIAAEIREAAIKDLMQIDDVYYQQAADIYDRGYRKFEIVDES